MKWVRKYDVDIDKIHLLNINGYSIHEISEMKGIPVTTLCRYLKESSYEVISHHFRGKVTHRKKASEQTEYKCTFTWKNHLIRRFGYKCQICGYNIIVEAHHIIPLVNGGKTTIANGILLCPNHHAEVHAGLIDIALLKREELLESPEEDNQQPSLESKWLNPERVKEGSTTSSQVKTVKEPRASRLDRRITKDEFLSNMI